MRTKGGYHEGLEKLFFDNARCSTKGIGYTGRKYYAGGENTCQYNKERRYYLWFWYRSFTFSYG